MDLLKSVLDLFKSSPKEGGLDNYGPFPHRFEPPIEKGRYRAQIRVAVEGQESLSLELLKHLALSFCRLYREQAGGAFLIQFFSNLSALEGWDRSGLIQPDEQEYYLGHVAVDTNEAGYLYITSSGVPISSADNSHTHTMILRQELE